MSFEKIDYEKEYKDKIKKRHSNYVRYYELNGYYNSFTREELESKTLEEILDLMPQNTCVDEYKEAFGFYVTKHITSFQIGKIIDGSWYIEYSSGRSNELIKDQYKLISYRYEKDLKQGLIKAYLELKKITLGWFNEIKEGKRQISLSDSWDIDGDELFRQEQEYLKTIIN